MSRKFKIFFWPTVIGCLIILLAATQATAAFNNYSMLFDGSNEYVSAPSINFNTDYTIGLWANWNSLTVDVSQVQTLVGESYSTYGPSSGLSWAGSGYEFFYHRHIKDISTYSDVQSDVFTPVVGNWYHIVVTYNKTTKVVTFYVNGSQLGNTKTHTQNWEVRGNLEIGMYHQGATPFAHFSGLIDEVSVWNKALSSNEVSEIYNNGSPGNLLNHSAQTNLVSWWRMGDGASWDETNWTIPDQKGTNDGTSVNMEEADRRTDALSPPIPSGTTFMAR